MSYVKVIREGAVEVSLVPFESVKRGDTIFLNDSPFVCDEDAHQSGDASYDGFLLYGEDGESYFPEDLDGGPVFVSFCRNTQACWDGVLFQDKANTYVTNGVYEWELNDTRSTALVMVPSIDLPRLIQRMENRHGGPFSARPDLLTMLKGMHTE